MAYDFIGLVNDVNRRLNEVELNSNNFNSATGFYSMAKDAINSSIRKVNQEAFEWPFNHVEQEDTLTPGQVRYAYPTDAKTIDNESYRIKRDATIGNETKRLKLISYEEYLDKYLDDEYNTDDTSLRSIPEFVFRTPNREYGVYPAPDEAYKLAYEYYSIPTDLSSATDVPTLPEQFRYLIVDGAMYHVFIFRGNTQDAGMYQQRFEEGLKDLRSIYTNRYEYLRDTRIR